MTVDSDLGNNEFHLDCWQFNILLTSAFKIVNCCEQHLLLLFELNVFERLADFENASKKRWRPQKAAVPYEHLSC
jgi:hypothetical protein